MKGAIDSSHLACQYCISHIQLMSYWKYAKQLSKCWNKSSNNWDKKRGLKRSETEKKLRLGLNPQLSWLTTVAKSMIFGEKTAHQLDSSHFSTHWAVTAVVFFWMLLRFSPLLRLQPVAECKLTTALTHSNKLGSRRMMGFWCYAVDTCVNVSSPGELLAWQTDRISAFYVV